MTDQKLQGLAALSAHYDACFCDVWGVLHNGLAGHETAIEALKKLKKSGVAVVLVTNAPRPASAIAPEIEQLGVTTDVYDHIVTSGDATRDIIKTFAGKTLYRVGPVHDDVLFAGLNVKFGSIEEANAIVCTDLESGLTPEDYQDQILLWKSKNLPFICANPDKVVEVGDSIIYCGGALADVYEAAGGEVIMAGKPFSPIYDRATMLAAQRLGFDPKPNRTLAIGDSARTDATGAANHNFDFYFVSGSIHAQELGPLDRPNPAAIEKLIAPTRAKMVAYAPRLFW